MLKPAIFNVTLYLHRKLMKSSLSEPGGNKQLQTSDSPRPVPKEPFLSAILSFSHDFLVFSGTVCIHLSEPPESQELSLS